MQRRGEGGGMYKQICSNCSDPPCLTFSAICAGGNDSSSFRLACARCMAARYYKADGEHNIMGYCHCMQEGHISARLSKPGQGRPHSCVAVWRWDQDLHTHAWINVHQDSSLYSTQCNVLPCISHTLQSYKYVQLTHTYLTYIHIKIIQVHTREYGCLLAGPWVQFLLIRLPETAH